MKIERIAKSEQKKKEETFPGPMFNIAHHIQATHDFDSELSHMKSHYTSSRSISCIPHRISHSLNTMCASYRC